MTPDPKHAPLSPPPRPRQLDRLSSVIEPLARVLQPKVYGVERIPDRGVLFVGNHTLYGLIDVPFMLAELWKREIEVRPLGDHGHYAIPVWRNLLEMCGMVRGTRKNVRALMRDGQNVLVYPGGGGEVLRQRGERYRLKWKERLGFARLAIEFGYPIVPFAGVGVEEMFDLIADDATPVLGEVSHLMKRLVGMPLPPVGVGVGPLLPRPERLYFWFGEPIDTAAFAGHSDDDAAARAVRDLAQEAVERGITFLQAERDADPRRGLARRLRWTSDEPPLAQSDPDAWFVVRGLDAWNHSGPASVAAWLNCWVVLEDLPDWPDSGEWHGRDAAIARLDEVTTVLGGRWVHVRHAQSFGEEVLVIIDLRTGRAHEGVHVGIFHITFEIQQGEITRIRVFGSREDALAALGCQPAELAAGV
ncbi:MAG TPA: lysophospholipid acyltransferase family protein [Solirubrobacteraceae bacterium]|nr:lysophospholipid acyltransferase family protein [Solirubrobacteraceae bacterium]